MEKTYKYVPFDIELAKKIQSGEIEGRIVAKSKKGYISATLTQLNTVSNTFSVYHGDNHVEIIYGHNSMLEYLQGSSMLFIELPEETPKPELKQFDKIKIHLEGDRYDNWIATVACIHGNLIGVKVNSRHFVFYDSKNIELVESYEEKPGFKPFEKVLVRQSDKNDWRVAFYSHYNEEENLHVTAWLSWYQCIPYEGNEHLVGTSNNPY